MNEFSPYAHAVWVGVLHGSQFANSKLRRTVMPKPTNTFFVVFADILCYNRLRKYTKRG